MGIIDRILEFIAERGLTKREFYSKCGLANGYLDKVKDIGSEKLYRIATAYPEINLYWLVLGKGNMINGKERPDEKFQESIIIEELTSKLGSAQIKIIELQDKIIQLQEHRFSDRESCDKPTHRSRPV